MNKFVTLLTLAGMVGLMAAPAEAKWGWKHNKQDQSGQMGQSSTSPQPSTFSEQPGMSEEKSSIGEPSTISGQVGVSGQMDVMSPKQHFLAARSSFDQGDFNVCAQHLRAGAEVLRNNAGKAHGDVADNLRGTAKDLDKLADKVQQGKLKDFRDVTDKFGDAYKNLADYNYQLAREHYQRSHTAGTPPGRDVETGNYLNRSVGYLEEWSVTTGRTIKGGTRTALDAIKDLAGKMVTGTGWATEQAGGAIDNFGTTIKGWGRDIQEPGPQRGRISTEPSTAPAEPGSRY